MSSADCLARVIYEAVCKKCEGVSLTQRKAKCGICQKYVKVVPVEKPRAEGEVEFICKEHGVVNQYIEFEKH